MDSDDKRLTGWVCGGAGWLLLVITGLACLFAWGCPKYRVYQQGMVGKARLREAESSRRILIEEANAKKEAATSLAAAEVERAKGVAEANQIIGASLKDNEGYLRYLWIQGLHDGNGETVYIPTEAGMPILEAGKRKDKE